MTNLGAAFVRLVGRAAEGLNNSLRLWCGVCGKETVHRLIDESRGTETYRCTECHVGTQSYTVR